MKQKNRPIIHTNFQKVQQWHAKIYIFFVYTGTDLNGHNEMAGSIVFIPNNRKVKSSISHISDTIKHILMEFYKIIT
ncbi:unnamed protein product [Acanthoscelides obtectus]|uniref:Uncharacterized protein n=1 Tax=Acanthoscelides obtectus TaxID=200917 RepID=A0A9P0KSD1_ACAOB|nr:unnamed protein product [Acanthoscelides obtectus]CAK1660473.1 hypothetical protein AOBTE_LOCUS22094 [Acanthoscelides obtectus]